MSADYAGHLLKIAVAHICGDRGFNGAEQSATATLSEVLRRYIETISRFATQNAELAGRTNVTLHDLLQVFDDDSALPRPVPLKALREMAQEPEIPFGVGVPSFPVTKSKKRPRDDSTDIVSNNAGPHLGHAHIPSFLPPFPHKHTFKHTEVDALERTSDAKTLRQEKLKQKRQVQNALSRLQDSRAPSFTHKSTVCSDVSGNPFTAPVLHQDSNGATVDTIALAPFNPRTSVVAPTAFLPAAAAAEAKRAAAIDEKQMSKEERILAGMYNDGDDGE
jgi:histone H3/H4